MRKPQPGENLLLHKNNGLHWFTIAEWRGSRAWMTDGSTFKWCPIAGFNPPTITP